MKIFFDVDGVLIDGWHAHPARRKRWDLTLEKDLGIDPEKLQREFFQSPAGTFPSLMHACVSGASDLKQVLADILPALGYAGTVEGFVSYWFEKDSHINRDVLEVVQHLAANGALELYLATGQEHYRAAYLWHDLGFKEYFNDIFYSAKVGHLKSSPAFFDEINSRLGIRSDERPLHFDDHEDVVTLARQRGWDSCVFETVDDIRGHPRLQTFLQT